MQRRYRGNVLCKRTDEPSEAVRSECTSQKELDLVREAGADAPI